jgi:hypothetical protein
MLKGVALAYHALPLGFIEQHNLPARVHGRGGEREVQFLWADFLRVLPVWLPEGRLVLATWGNARDESRRLPLARWASLSTWASGGWTRYNAVLVDVPATLIGDGRWDRLVWVGIRQGLHAVLARDEVGRPRVFPLCEPASYYYHIMTRADWMPVFVGERF